MSSSRCHCPELDPVAHVGTDPITCRCCGRALVLTCPGECGTQHVARSIDAAVSATRRRRGDPVRCPRCGDPMPKRTGRPTAACERCMTPQERKRLALHRAAAERRKRKRQGAPALIVAA